MRLGSGLDGNGTPCGRRSHLRILPRRRRCLSARQYARGELSVPCPTLLCSPAGRTHRSMPCRCPLVQTEITVACSDAGRESCRSCNDRYARISLHRSSFDLLVSGKLIRLPTTCFCLLAIFYNCGGITVYKASLTTQFHGTVTKAENLIVFAGFHGDETPSPLLS